MFIYRVLSALIGIPLALWFVWVGGIPLAAAIFIISLLGITEMDRIWRNMETRILFPAAVVAAALFTGAAFWNYELLAEIALFILLTGGTFYLAARYPSFGIGDLAATVFTSFYPGWLLTHVLFLRELPNGFHFVLLVLVSTWSTDTTAYFTGMKLGRTKLAPVLSPKKSVEGAAGGLAGSVAAALAIGLWAGHLNLVHYLVMGVLVGTFGQAGDLVESAFKRMAGIKDSGTLIPGHGGILDRFDSLLVTAPAVFYYLKLLGI